MVDRGNRAQRCFLLDEQIHLSRSCSILISMILTSSIPVPLIPLDLEAKAPLALSCGDRSMGGPRRKKLIASGSGGNEEKEAIEAVKRASERTRMGRVRGVGVAKEARVYEIESGEKGRGEYELAEYR